MPIKDEQQNRRCCASYHGLKPTDIFIDAVSVPPRQFVKSQAEGPQTSHLWVVKRATVVIFGEVCES